VIDAVPQLMRLHCSYKHVVFMLRYHCYDLSTYCTLVELYIFCVWYVSEIGYRITKTVTLYILRGNEEKEKFICHAII